MSTEHVEENNFNNLKNDIIERYINLLNQLNSTIIENGLNNEKHLKSFTSNLEQFKKNNNDYIFNFIMRNYLHVLTEIVDKNLDYFLTQKPYILKRSKRGKKKIPNKKSTSVCNGTMLRYIISTLKQSPKEGKISKNNEIDNFFEELTDIFRNFSNEEENHLEGLRNYISTNFSKSSVYKRQLDVLNNFDQIINEEVIEEEVSSDEEIPEKKSETNSSDTKLPFDNNFIENSSIGQLAKEISDELNPDDLKNLENPGDILGSLFGNGDSNSNLSNIIGKVVSKVGNKLKDGSIDHGKLANEANNIMSSMGGLPNMGGNMGDIFKNMFNNISK